MKQGFELLMLFGLSYAVLEVALFKLRQRRRERALSRRTRGITMYEGFREN